MRITDLAIAANTNLRREKLLKGLEMVDAINRHTSAYFYFDSYSALEDKRFFNQAGLLEDPGEFLTMVLKQALRVKIESEIAEIEQQLVALGVEL